jgi:2-polyprenyl-3-methyl-5-hydroxy-6-metoxy-1,4-benzoquinol methylase
MVSQETFKVSFCVTCGCGVTSPRPNEIAPYYESPSYTSHQDQNAGFFGVVYGWARSLAAVQKLRLIRSASKKSKGALLDYGCGVGVFSGRAERAGWQVDGIEVSPEARKRAQEKLKHGVVVPHRSDLDSARTYDVVTLFHVLEHLEDPSETLTWIRAKLNTGGALIVAVPNYESPDAQHYGPHWAAYDVPIHYWHFTKQSVGALAKATGWFVSEVRPMRMDAFYVSLLSEAYKTGTKNWLSAIYQGVRSNVKGGRTNASSLIYVLRKAS